MQALAVGLVLGLFLLALVGCQGEPPVSPTPAPTRFVTGARPTLTPVPTPLANDPPTLPIDRSDVGVTFIPPLSSQVLFGYTYPQADGGRLAAEAANLQSGSPLELRLDGIPTWVVGAPTDQGSVWAVVLQDGTVQGFLFTHGQVSRVTLSPEKLPAGMPPLLVVNQGVPGLLTAPLESASIETHPVVLDKPARLAFLDEVRPGLNDLVIWHNGELARFNIQAPSSARILQDEDHRLLLFAGAKAPAPAAEGDEITRTWTAASLVLVQTDPSPAVLQTIAFPDGVTATDSAPAWADLDGDGSREIAVVLNGPEGTYSAIYAESGALLAASTPQTGVELSLVAALPAIETEAALLVLLGSKAGTGVVEIQRFFNGSLQFGGSFEGGTFPLAAGGLRDMAAMGDFDGNGQPNASLELLAPNAGMTGLAAIHWGPEPVSPAWGTPLGAKITTNLAIVNLRDGGMAVAVGLETQRLVLWLP